MIKSSREKYKTTREGSICNDVRKYKCLIFESVTFMSSARKMITSCRRKYKEKLWEVQMFSLRSTHGGDRKYKCLVLKVHSPRKNIYHNSEGSTHKYKQEVHISSLGQYTRSLINMYKNNFYNRKYNIAMTEIHNSNKKSTNTQFRGVYDLL
jgi:hypothetical protein